MNNRKGFTLVELLAVIVILGIIITISGLAVSNIIQNSRAQTFIDSAKTFIDAAKTLASDSPGRYYPLENGRVNSSIIYVRDLPIKNGSNKKSSYDKSFINEKSFVRIEGTTYGYDFYISLEDDAGNFIRDIKDSDLKIARVNDKTMVEFDISSCSTCKVIDKVEDNSFEKCVFLGDINGDRLVDNKDYEVCTLIVQGSYNMTEAEYKVLTNNGTVSVGYSTICTYIRDHSNGYGSTIVKIPRTINGFDKFSRCDC